MFQARLLRFASASLLALGIAFAASPAQAQVTEAEPNSACLSAEDLSTSALPLSINGELTSPDVDFYRITATPGDLITILQRGSMSNGGTLYDPYLGVYGSACNLLAYADYDFDSGFWLDARIEMHVPADGVLVLAASSAYDWQFAGNGNSSGTYLLDVSRVATAQAVGGRVVDSKTGAPLQNAWLELMRCSDGACWATLGYTYSDADGRFRFVPGDTVWDSILRAGDYSVVVNPLDGYVAMQTPIFPLAEGQDLDLGNIAVSPVPLVGSIRGRIVDLNTRQPLSGDAVPFARVQLEACTASGYCYVTAIQSADAQGAFEFQSGYSGPLQAGRYRLTVAADQYFSTESQIFSVADQQHHNAGDVAVKSYPVRLALESGCGSIPSAGGTCQFSVKVTNGGSAPLKADTWTLVRAISAFAPGEMTKFPVGPTRSVVLDPAASATLSYSFEAQASLHDGATVCARAYVSDKKDPLSAIGSHDLFCLIKGADGFAPLTEKEKREAIKSEKVKD